MPIDRGFSLGIIPASQFCGGHPIQVGFVPDKLIVSRSLRKTLRKNVFSVTFDQAFSDVIAACAEPDK